MGLVAAYCNAPENHTAFISNVSVAANWRGSGIGGRLIEACHDHAAQSGYARVELRVAAANAAALRLYARHGFRSCGRENEEIIMRRELRRQRSFKP